MADERVEALRRRVRRAEGEEGLAASRLEAAVLANQEAREALGHALAARELAQGAAQRVQSRAHERLAGVVSLCLGAVFDDPYEFTLAFERKRGRTECRLAFLRGGEEVPAETGQGGGEVDVASFALRVACLMMAHPPLRRFVCLDEPAKWLHGAEYKKRFAQLLLRLSDELNFQILMVTGVPEFAVGDVVTIS